MTEIHAKDLKEILDQLRALRAFVESPDFDKQPLFVQSYAMGAINGITWVFSQAPMTPIEGVDDLKLTAALRERRSNPQVI